MFDMIAWMMFHSNFYALLLAHGEIFSFLKYSSGNMFIEISSKHKLLATKSWVYGCLLIYDLYLVDDELEHFRLKFWNLATRLMLGCIDLAVKGP
ncbi:hypothetical protein VNO78_33163 [Psophocarpus tetragonolobus]|uniref:Uncharacterized protein n=1 Tax=Psophocarpus tetragonolobus TaxID=3891 RepID=A0AAN9P3M7_PSOTE